MTRRLARDVRGATLVEFALVSPVMLLLVMGLCDLCYRSYAQSILSGAVQRAARDATLEGSGSTAALAAIDQKVANAVTEIAHNATWQSSRKTYQTFGQAAPEPFTDSNGNGVRDAGECFADVNRNGSWDADPGANGQGGANDVTIYTMTVTYPRMFPLMRVIGLSDTQTISAKTILKNQPYGVQQTSDPPTVCT